MNAEDIAARAARKAAQRKFLIKVLLLIVGLIVALWCVRKQSQKRRASK